MSLLSQICPEDEQYKLYYAQTLQKSCQYEAAMKASFTLESPALKEKVVKLQVSSMTIIDPTTSLAGTQPQCLVLYLKAITENVRLSAD